MGGAQGFVLDVEGMNMAAWAYGLGKESRISAFAGGSVDGDVSWVDCFYRELLRAFGDANRIYGSQGNLRKLGARFSFQAARPSSPSSER